MNKKRVLSTILAALIAGNSTSALAKDKKDECKPTTSITQTINENDIYLDDEYLAYLKENDIQVIDGDIIVETVDQYRAIVKYYKDYLTEKGIKASIKGIADYIMTYNAAFIDSKFRNKLFVNRVVSEQISNYLTEGNSVSYNILEYRINCIKNNKIDDFSTLTTIIFNNKTRECVAYFEEQIFRGAKFSSENKKEEFLNVLDNVLNFTLGNESDFPYHINDLEATAKHLFTGMLVIFSTLYQGLSDIDTYIFDPKTNDEINAILEPYRSNVTPASKILKLKDSKS